MPWVLLAAALIAATAFGAAWHQANADLNNLRIGGLPSINALLSENKEFLKVLQTDSALEKGSGILGSYLAKIRADGVAKHAGMKQRLGAAAPREEVFKVKCGRCCSSGAPLATGRRNGAKNAAFEIRKASRARAPDSPMPGECSDSTNSPADEEGCRECPLREERGAENFPNLDLKLWKGNRTNTLNIGPKTKAIDARQAIPFLRGTPAGEQHRGERRYKDVSAGPRTKQDSVALRRQRTKFVWHARET